jgi:hypothetical protein
MKMKKDYGLHSIKKNVTLFIYLIILLINDDSIHFAAAVNEARSKYLD